MANFVPSKIFKCIGNANLKAIFNKFQLTPPPVDWESDNIDVKTLQNYWSDLKSDVQDGQNRVGRLFAFFQEIHEAADAKVKLNRIIHAQINWYGKNVELPDEFDSWHPYRQAAFIYLNYEPLWKAVVNKMTVEIIQHREKWCEYTDLPPRDTGLDFNDIQKVTESAICNFFRPIKKCRSCRLEQFSYTSDTQFFFATLEDEPIYIESQKDGEEDFEYQRIIPPYRITFAYNFKEGEFALYAEQLKKSDMDKLADCILAAMLVLPGEYSKVIKRSFDLSCFNNFSFLFPAYPGVSSARVKSIVLVPLDNPNEKIIFENKSGSAYDCVTRRLDIQENTQYETIRVTIAVEVSDQSKNFRSLTFELGTNTCNLKGMTEDKRLFGEKLIRFWRLRKCGK